jgi:hypothetical protein
MKSVVDDDELKVRIVMKWMSQHSHKIPPMGNSDKSDVAGQAQVHLFYKFCKYVELFTELWKDRFHHLSE